MKSDEAHGPTDLTFLADPSRAQAEGAGTSRVPYPLFWWAILSVGTSVSVAVLALSVWLEPDGRGFGTHVQIGLAPCAYLQRTGHPCPSCGLTTSFASMAHGRPIAAWRANPAGVLLFLITLATPIWLVRCYRVRSDPLSFLQGPIGRFTPFLLVLFVLFQWLVRNGLPPPFRN